MGGKAKAPPAPDYSQIAAAQQKSAEYSLQLGREQLAWAREQYSMDRDLTDIVVADHMRRQDALDEQGAADRKRYEEVYQPLEDELVKDSKDYNSAARREMEAGQAQSDVTAQFELARTAAQDRLESFGIDPSQTRSAALDTSSRIAEATARAGAGNMARERVEGIGRALRSEAINVGRGYPGQVAQSYGLAMQSGNAAVNNQLATTQSGSQSMGNPTQWQGLGNDALTGWANTLNMGFQNQMDRAKFKQQQSGGWGSALGMIGGIGMRYAMGGFGAAEGGTVPEQAEVDAQLAHQGVPITDEMQPPGNPAIDGVPARLTPGEFVVPEDVVRWKGEEFFQRTIESARKKKEEAPAKPQVRAVPIEQPAVDTTGALPIGVS